MISQVEQNIWNACLDSRHVFWDFAGLPGFACDEPLLIITALLTVYIVLGILYESYIHPITILSTLPSAGVGAVLALMIFHLDLSVIALIGIILLIGLVKKNAILMIDFALVAQRNEHKDPKERHLSSMLAPLSAHSDDDHGSFAWRRAARVRHGHGFRVAPAARDHHHRRAHIQPDADALHHPGGLSLHGSYRPLAPTITDTAAPHNSSRGRLSLN